MESIPPEVLLKIGKHLNPTSLYNWILTTSWYYENLIEILDEWGEEEVSIVKFTLSNVPKTIQSRFYVVVNNRFMDNYRLVQDIVEKKVLNIIEKRKTSTIASTRTSYVKAIDYCLTSEVRKRAKNKNSKYWNGLIGGITLWSHAEDPNIKVKVTNANIAEYLTKDEIIDFRINHQWDL